jgi:hypothetical protein
MKKKEQLKRLLTVYNKNDHKERPAAVLQEAKRIEQEEQLMKGVGVPFFLRRIRLQ